MALTRAAVEREVGLLYGPILNLVGLWGEAADGSVPTLNAPIRDALRALGYPVADPVQVVDADLAPVDNFAVRRLIDLVGLDALRRVDRDWWRAAPPAPPGGLTPEALDDVRRRLAGWIADLERSVAEPFTPFVQTIALGRFAAGALQPSPDRPVGDGPGPSWGWREGCP